ncbi:MAG TPA: sensor histidine kinase, partial [Spirochaetia bacterium]|nr:sensor histidine kinase [Spirochaetia bacterium]
LVANELCTNALKYAFPQEVRTRRCELRVELRRVGGQRVLLAIADNGVGLPTDFELSRTATLGMQIVEKLVKQLGGELSLEKGAGTRWLMEFDAG